MNQIRAPPDAGQRRGPQRRVAVARILVIHWNAAEAAARAERLRGEGFETSCFTDQRDGAGFRALRENPPGWPW